MHANDRLATRVTAVLTVGVFSAFTFLSTGALAADAAARTTARIPAPHFVLPPNTPDPAEDAEALLGVATPASGPYFVHHAPDPVNLRNANLFLPLIDVVIPSSGPDLRIARAYNSRSNIKGSFGYGWTFNYDVHVEKDGAGGYRVIDPDGFNSSFFAAGANRREIRARMARDIAHAMWEADQKGGGGQSEDYYAEVASRLMTDDGYLEENRERFGDYSKKSQEGRFWSTDRGLIQLTVTDKGFRRLMPDGTEQYFDHEGRWTRVVDRNSNSLRAKYNDAGQLVLVRDHTGRSMKLKRDGAGRITQVTDPIGRKWSYTYDSGGNLVESKDPLGGSTLYNYDGEHNLTRIVYPDGAATEIRYDAERDWVLEQTGPGPKHSKFNYEVLSKDGQRTRTTVTQANGAKLTYDYDNTRGAVAVTDPLGHRTTTYHSKINGKPERVVDALGHETQYKYDKNSGALVAIRDAAGGVTKFTYDPRTGNLRSRTDRSGTTLGVRYDGRGNPVDIAGPLGSRRAFEYDDRGNVTKMIDGVGAETHIKYDDFGNPISVQDAEGGLYQMEYDRAGRLLVFRDARGGTSRFAYDALNRVRTITDASGRKTQLDYDAVGRRTGLTAPGGATTKITYNAIGQATRIVRPNGGVVQYDYDDSANLVGITDPMGAKYRYDYDKAGRRIAAVDANGGRVRYEYDAIGNLIGVVRPGGARTAFRYNALDQLVEATDPLGGKARFGYDARGNLASVRNQAGDEVRAQYDELGRIVALREAEGGTWKFGYDANGRRTQIVDPTGGRTEITYDKNGRRTRVVEPRGEHRFLYGPGGELRKYRSPDGLQATFSYDPAGRLVQVSAPDGTMKRTYDAAGRVRQIIGPDGSKYTLRHDKGGRVTGVAGPGGAWKYTYDRNNRLTSVVNGDARLAFKYDAMGNVLSKTDVGAGAVEKFTYNADGYMASFQNIAGEKTTFQYNAVGRLVASRGPKGQSSYSYDSVGNLTQAKGTDGAWAKYSYNAGGVMTSFQTSTGNKARIAQQAAAAGYGGGNWFTRGIAKTPVMGAVATTPAGTSGGAAAAAAGASASALGAGGPAGGIRGPGAGGGGPRGPFGGSTVSTAGTSNNGTPAPNTVPVGSGNGGLEVTPNPDGTYTVTYGTDVGDGYATAYANVGPGGINGGGINYSLPIGGFPVDIGLDWDPINGFSLTTSLTLPGGLGSAGLRFYEDRTISLLGEVNVPLGNGGFITLRPELGFGPDGVFFNSLVDVSVPGVGDFSVGFKDNKFEFLDGTFSIPLPGGGFLDLDGRLVNTPNGLAFAGDGSIVMPGGMGTFDFDVAYLDGDLLFGGSGNLNIPLPGGGFLSLSPEIDYGPDGLALSGPYAMAINVGNGQIVDTSGDLSSLLPTNGYSNFCLTCWLMFFI